MSNIILKKFVESSVSIPNETAQDLELSIEALGALTRMLSYSENFEFKSEWLIKSWKVGRDRLRAVFRELKNKGFLKIDPKRNENNSAFDGQEWSISNRPQSDWISVALKSRTTENQSCIKKEEIIKKEEKERNNSSDKSDVVAKDNTNVLSTEESSESETIEKQQTLCGEAQEVLTYWKLVMEHPKAKNSKERLQKIKMRLKEGFSTEELKLAIDGCKKSPHHQGENETGTIHDGIKLIFKDADNVERFISYNQTKKGVKNAKQSNTEITNEWQQLAGQIYGNASEGSANRTLDQ